MRRSLWVVLVLLVVSFGIGVRDVRALPVNEVWDTYYDCALNDVGLRILSCGGHIFTDGQQSGAYRYREQTHCETGAWTGRWYYWSGSSWVLFSGPPGPNC